MNYFNDASQLVGHAKHALERIGHGYRESLNEQAVKPELLIEIKNLMENLRSALDFTALGLFTAFVRSQKNPRIYFPYARLDQSREEFISANIIEKNIPGISAVRPDIADRLEAYQHYSSPSNRWLPMFMDLNNENKHRQLTPQVRHEHRGLRIESEGAGMELGPGASVRLGTGASISFGNVSIGGEQQFSGENPARFHGSGKQTILIWVSFTFSSNGEEVMSFLDSAVKGTDAIVKDLRAV